MDWVTGIFVYFLIWWVAIFCVLPWGITRDTSAETGGSGAPLNPQLKKKFLITTGVSLLVWLFVYAAVNAHIVDFRAISRQMIEEDTK